MGKIQAVTVKRVSLYCYQWLPSICTHCWSFPEVICETQTVPQISFIIASEGFLGNHNNRTFHIDDLLYLLDFKILNLSKVITVMRSMKLKDADCRVCRTFPIPSKRSFLIPKTTDFLFLSFSKLPQIPGAHHSLPNLQQYIYFLLR